MRRRADVLWRASPGYLVLSTPNGEVTSVTGPGVEVWELLSEPLDADSIVMTLAERYAADVELIRRDLAPLFETLIRGGYVDTDG